MVRFLIIKVIMQTTLSKDIRCAGVGLHSGKKVEVVIRPAPVDTGIVFSVLKNGHRETIVPKPTSVVSTGLATTLGQGSAQVSTVEHLMATFVGLEIDNAIVEVHGAELPIMDGSAAAFVYLLSLAGLKKQHKPRSVAKIVRPLLFEHNGKRILAKPFNGLRIDYEISFAHPRIGKQKFSYISSPRSFVDVIARARTFGFLKDVEFLQGKGLALGGSLDNAVVFDDYGPINPEGLRFADEQVRHKILDFMGDIAVGQHRLWGHFQVCCSGHEHNNQFVRYVFENSSEYLQIVEPSGYRNPGESADVLPAPAAVPAWA